MSPSSSACGVPSTMKAVCILETTLGAEMGVGDRAASPYWAACRPASVPSLVPSNRKPLSTTVTVLPSWPITSKGRGRSDLRAETDERIDWLKWRLKLLPTRRLFLTRIDNAQRKALTNSMLLHHPVTDRPR